MDKRVLDDDSMLPNQFDIPDQTLIEIYQARNVYPEFFTSLVKEELLYRNVEIKNLNPKITPAKDIEILEWLKVNPRFQWLVLLLAIFSGFYGFFIVIITVGIASNPNELSRQRNWKKLVRVLTILLMSLVVFILLEKFT